MLLNLSYRKKETNAQLLTQVGKPISWMRRLRMKGIGSQRFIIEEANPEITQLLEQSTSAWHCNIDLRTTGFLIWFRVKQDNYALALPYHTLSVIKSDHSFIIHDGPWKIRLSPANNVKLDHEFINKLLKMKSEVSGSRPV